MLHNFGLCLSSPTTADLFQNFFKSDKASCLSGFHIDVHFCKKFREKTLFMSSLLKCIVEKGYKSAY